MRISRLDLLRYGGFTDVSLPFPKAPLDLHIVYGPNEAGKSTSLTAIEDLLFGIPHNSIYNFRHDYSAMRVGGILEHDSRTIEFRRRKGNKDTLLGPDDLPLSAGEKAIAAFLGGCDRPFLQRMFSLNHHRLAQGGREILENKDEVGQVLFSAGAGVGGLRDRLASLADEADQLWAPRKSKSRKYHIALGELEQAEKLQDEQTVTASKWQEIKRGLDTAQEACEAIESEIEEKSAEQRKLGRIRRVYSLLRRSSEVESEIAGLGAIPALPLDAEAQVMTAVQHRYEAQSRMNELVGQLDQARSERAEMRCDDGLLERSDDIERLRDQRVETRKAKLDLVRLSADLTQKSELLDRRAKDLGWVVGDTAAIVASLPQRTSVAAVRSLLGRRGELSQATAGATTSLEEALERVHELKVELDQAPTPLDTTTLAAVLASTRSVDDMAPRIKVLEGEAAEAGAAIGKQLRALRPQVSDADALESMPIPPPEEVQSLRDALRDVGKEIDSCVTELANAEGEVKRRRQEYDRRTRDGHAVLPDDLERARKERDRGWSLVRKRYVDGTDLPDRDIADFIGDADLPTAYERRVVAVDTLADRRFENAKASGEAALIARQIDEAQHTYSTLSDREKELRQKRQVIEAEWKALWTDAPFEPLSPDAMIVWLESRKNILALVEKRNAAAVRLTVLRSEESDARTALIAELTALGQDTDASTQQSVKVIREVAVALQHRQETMAEGRKTAEEHLRKALNEENRKKDQVQKAKDAWDEWLGAWRPALTSLKFAADTPHETVAVHLDVLDEMRSLSGDIDQLQRNRIAKIQRDVDAFEASVAALASVVASDLAGQQPEEAALRLEKRLEEAKLVRDRQTRKDEAIISIEQRLETCRDELAVAQRTIDALQEIADVDTLERLREAIRTSQLGRSLAAEKDKLADDLIAQGDGHSAADLRSECEGIDLDHAAAREDSLQLELKTLRERLTPAAELRLQARQALDAIGGDGRAAQAAATRQEALASMQNASEQYVRVRTAQRLLEWAIDRYRREKQAPLLKLAGTMFATLTSGSFAGLRVEYDDQDNARLAGIRGDGGSVGTYGMSDGTADQLYLALRLASIEEYIGRAHVLPFVGDDLLINFDDDRAAAAITVLAELGRKTQVLLFTHHRHLVEIARSTLGEGINVVTLREIGAAASI